MARFRNPTRTITRGLIAYGYAHIAPVYLVNEFHKSGGTWISNLLSAALRVPFHDNKTPLIEPQVLKSHFIRQWMLKGGVTVWRDGRDVMLSWYNHCFHKFSDIPINHGLVDLMRAKYRFADYSDVKANLAAFLEGEFNRPTYPSFTWAQFVDRWSGHPRFEHVRYEDFRADAAASLTKLMRIFPNVEWSDARAAEVAQKFDIKRLTKGREAQEGTSFFVGTGKTGAWRDLYSDEALEIFNYHAGSQLRALGYTE